MAPRFGIQAPKCPTCGTSVYAAERIVGPHGKDYHRPCLKCCVCGRRLDSTLLLEHEGRPICRSCHREHLGQGKGGFATAVPLHARPPLKVGTGSNAGVDDGSSDALRTPTLSSATHVTPSRAESGPVDSLRPSETVGADVVHPRHDDLQTHNLSDIRISPRKGTSPYAGSGSEKHPTLSRKPLIKPADRSIPGEAQTCVHGSSSDKRIGTIDHAIACDSDPRITADNGGINASHQIQVQPESEQSQSVRNDPDCIRRKDGRSDGLRAEGVCHAATITSEGRGATMDRSAGQSDSESKEGTSDTLSASHNRRPEHSPSRQAADTSRASKAFMRSTNIPRSGVDRFGLAGSVASATSGTPLCARCEKPVYFAEQKQAAGRKWHRACLHCDGCRSTLEVGKLEEGPPRETSLPHICNVWCRPCYSKRFGPKGKKTRRIGKHGVRRWSVNVKLQITPRTGPVEPGINTAGISLPEHHSGLHSS